MARKRKIFDQVEVIDIGDKGKAIGRRPNGEIVLVEGAVPGDVVEIECGRKRKGIYTGRVIKTHSYSNERTEPFCAHFTDCGGCKWQNLAYAAQLKYKERQVFESVRRISGAEPREKYPILGALNDRLYRNKLEFTFSSSRWLTAEEVKTSEQIEDHPAVGFHPPGTYYKVLDVETCHLQNEPTNRIKNHIRDFARTNFLTFYDIRKHDGLMRNLVIRVFNTGDVMVMVIFGNDEPDQIKLVMDNIVENFPNIASLWYIINTKMNDSYIDLEPEHYHGTKYATEQLDHITYQIGPKSFFQTHTNQAVRLYQIAREFADLKADEVVYDLYCGLGSITLFMARDCREIIGIESVEAAIEDARQNAELNKIDNAHFYAADASFLIDPEIIAKYGRPNVIITDPPRAGMSKEVVAGILELLPDRVVYISCNPSTQARDIGLLSDAYSLEKLQPVDMFPHTSHIESVALLLKIEK